MSLSNYSAHGGLQKLENIILGRVSKLEQVFEGDEPNVSKDEEKVIHLPRLTDLQLDGLPNLVSFGPVSYHFVFQSLLILRVVDCPNITTRFSFDSEKSVHAKHSWNTGCGLCGEAGRSQLDYVRRFHDNVEKLQKKKRELADARKRLQHEIEEAKNQLLLIEDDVQNLQSRADETLSDMGTLEEEIQQNKTCLNWCPNWIWRYQLSKKAMKKTQDISELLEKCGRLGPVGYSDPTALPTIDFLCSKEFVVSESSKAAFTQIIEALKDENINMIGLWGMGGVGKTTLACEVGSLAKKLNLVDKN
ncbi:hypothetical protein J1N35_028561 [Gossypium stocksii]|uniref:NB-ARC domain-containing protein n=1 Tax=Gossypium stocksii TaxID=47602 RepID=A0A9D3UY52_9ROSI|nr:hypothetical protein J1N35_028561 [Gossypium stocksii]